MIFFVYILYSSLYNRYYIGQTNDFDDRLNRHNSGFEKTTAPYRPWKLMLLIQKDTRGEAMVLEKKLKHLNHERLNAFIKKYGGSPASQDDPA
jgi:putative endonuclease